MFVFTLVLLFINKLLNYQTDSNYWTPSNFNISRNDQFVIFNAKMKAVVSFYIIYVNPRHRLMRH